MQNPRYPQEADLRTMESNKNDWYQKSLVLTADGVHNDRKAIDLQKDKLTDGREYADCSAPSL